MTPSTGTPPQIRPFGTAGFRPGRPLTDEDITALVHAYADYVVTDAGGRPVIIGRDTRESSRKYLDIVAEQLMRRGIDVYKVEGPLSTPVASFVTKHFQSVLNRGRDIPLGLPQPAGTLLLTASHNPYQEGGIKILGSNGVNASKEVTNAIERYQRERLEKSPEELRALSNSFPGGGGLKIIDPYPAYFEGLSRLIDWQAIKDSHLKFALDTHYGTGQPFYEFLRMQGLNVIGNRTEHEPPEGYNSNSEPTPENLAGLSELIRSQGLALGIALDGDGDRFAAVDERGQMISVTDILALALNQLHQKGLGGGFARNQGTSHYLDALYAKLTGNSQVTVTPVGFKYLGAEIENSDGGLLLGAEGSGGATSGHHVAWEKDGLFIDALLLAATADAKREGQSISQKIEALRNSTPKRYAMLEASMTTEQKDAIIDAFTAMRAGGQLGEFAIDAASSQAHARDFETRFGTTDGVWLCLADNAGWLLVRGSGTEPKLRVYLEAIGNSQDEAVARRGALWQAIEQGLQPYPISGLKTLTDD